MRLPPHPATARTGLTEPDDVAVGLEEGSTAVVFVAEAPNRRARMASTNTTMWVANEARNAGPSLFRCCSKRNGRPRRSVPSARTERWPFVLSGLPASVAAEVAFMQPYDNLTSKVATSRLHRRRRLLDAYVQPPPFPATGGLDREHGSTRCRSSVTNLAATVVDSTRLLAKSSRPPVHAARSRKSAAPVPSRSARSIIRR